MFLIRIIAIDKFVKGSLLIIVGVYLLQMLHLNRNIHDTLHDLVNDLRIDPNNKYIHLLLKKTLGLNRRSLWYVYAGTLIYAGLYFIEGIGLFFDKAWAEWLTIIATAGFLPLEILELYREITPLRVIVFVLNILMVIYLALRLHWRHLAKLAGVDVKKDPEGLHCDQAKASAPDGNVKADSHR
jgi:uncharacterized membrane protein (DUF2068 family)